MLETIIKNALAGNGCTPEEARSLINCSEIELFTAATQVREAHFGRQIQLCSIINAKSGQCDMDCRFCSQSGHNSTEIEAYPFMKKGELKRRIEETISGNDRHCGVVTSGGKLSGDELNVLADTVRSVSNGKPGPVCASLGRLTEDELANLKDAGLTRFHHNLETSENYYPEVCSTQQWSQRLDTVKAAMATGLAVCCGGLFGLGESWDDRIELALTLRGLGVNSVPINFLYAHAGTPMKDTPPLAAEEALRIIAVYRFLLPGTTLRICGGRTHVLGERQADLFSAGANGLMTGNYLTIAGSQYETDLEMIRTLGLEIAQV
ncbi:biotin synthase BioB [Pontiella sulfatireligans]|uniref:Biotin synthase n=1 Tax=Pontiella sulfatireligans TaxID=2750658 RepID=A0A6C2UQ23_9BACT|nr:biotin synthase BioB [Pontiella sulfatireligans]VGO22390.1 Biotin synthase [Pontiella sulfatireligans]